jgi:hypothetical protein
MRSDAPLHLAEGMSAVAERARLSTILDLLYPLIWDGQYRRGVAANRGGGAQCTS